MLRRTLLASLGLLLAFTGCSESQVSESQATPDAASTQYIANTEPEGAVPVGEARQTVEDAEPVVLTGLVGGSREPFVGGLAAFTIVDPKVPHCQPEEGCPTPWDYCCTQDQVKDNVAMIKVVDDEGNPVATDARELLGVKELSRVVVKGTAERDEQGNLAVLADQVYVRAE